MNYDQLASLRQSLVGLKRFVLRKVYGMDLDPTVQMSLSAYFDKSFPKGIHVGAYSYVARGVSILTHDRTRGIYAHTRIGRNCFIGFQSIVLPGVCVGDNCIVAAGSIVTKDVPPNSIVAGNPASVIRSGISVGHYGRFADADEVEWEIRRSDPDAAKLSTREYRRRVGKSQ